LPSSELAFEYLGVALESTRGTAIAAPTHLMPFSGMITPTSEYYRPDESRGTLEEIYRTALVRTGSDWSMEGGADPSYAPLVFNMAVKAVTSPSTPTNGVLTRLWTFVPSQTADDIKTGTFFWGDPNATIYRSVYNYVNELTISGDASGTDGVTWSISGSGKKPAAFAAPALPAQSVGSLLMPQKMSLWMDTSSAIGTTAISDRLVSGEFRVSKNINPKYFAAGPTAAGDFSRLGRGKFHAEMTLVFELADQTQYALWEAGTTTKTRLRWNGDLIESVTPDYYNYLQADIYGPLVDIDWGDTAGTNRTVSLTIMSQYDATLGASWALYAQNTKTGI
jgi:hypothetical protein